MEDILYLGDTRSADDLAVSKLFVAAQKLLMFVLHDVSAQTFSQKEAALRLALRSLIDNRELQ